MHLSPWVARGVAAPAVALASLGFFPRQRPAPKPKQPFVVAIVERGSDWAGLQPVARFTGSGWVNTWPDPEGRDAPVPDFLQLPTSWLGKPVPRQWVLWSMSGAHMRGRVVAARRAEGCSGPIALVLQKTKATEPEKLRGFRVAVDSNQPVEGFRPVTTADPEWNALQPAVAETFRAHESSVENSGSLPLGSSSTARLITVPVTIESLMRPVSASGPVVYYFEATKRLPINRALGVSVAGWLTRSSARGPWTAFDVSGRVLSRDSAPVPVRTPIGLFRVLGRVYWLMRITDYEGSDTTLYDVSAAGTREILTTGGGGC